MASGLRQCNESEEQAKVARASETEATRQAKIAKANEAKPYV
jgi:hypothetical protein